MSDARINNGGARQGAGRKPNALKAELAGLLDKAWPKRKRKAAIQKLAAQAEEGDKEAVKILLAYAYGKPVEHKEIRGDEDAPLRIKVEYVGTGKDTHDPSA